GIPRKDFPAEARTRGGSRAVSRGNERLPEPAPHGKRLLQFSDALPPFARRPRSHIRYDFEYNASVSDARSRREWYRFLRRAAARYESVPAAYELDRPSYGEIEESIARYLHRMRGVRCDPEQVVLVSTYMQAFQMVLRVLVEPEERVLLEDPHSYGLRNAIRLHGCEPVPLPTDSDGLMIARVAERDEGARLLATNPSFLMPSGRHMPLARRLRLLERARERGYWILEFDHNNEYRYEGTPVESLQGLDDDGLVLHVGTFSRLFSPDPAIAYLVVPPHLKDVFRAEDVTMGNYCAPLECEVLAQFLDSGEMESFLRRLNRRLAGKRDAAREALRAFRDLPLTLSPSNAGLHVHFSMHGWSSARVEALANAIWDRGISIFPDEPYTMLARPSAGLLLGIATLEVDTIRRGIAELGEVIRAFIAREGYGRTS
ncbi:MAG: PLP-dependent aminotransferase family protein, partial [Gemmatimonadetes bacterium]|nr:PLP-dependent aminotransferase family protein [Gemmatimonadota bacterium]